MNSVENLFIFAGFYAPNFKEFEGAYRFGPDCLLNLTKESDVKNIDIKDGIFEWRMLLRETKYLTEERGLHPDLKGSRLHPDLEKFTELAHRKRSWRLMKYFLDSVDQEAP